MDFPGAIEKVSATVWELPLSFKAGMRVPARIYCTEKLLREMDDAVLDQISNVATLPCITGYALCMPDGHFGYGFPIGGVAAMNPENGVISPGGIGFDINCGMRLVRTELTLNEIKLHLKRIVDRLFSRIPAGVGSRGFMRLSRPEFMDVVRLGARWCIERGMGWPEDAELSENYGCIEEADPETVSDKAVERGIHQIGTLGSGNHYLEIQTVRPEHIYDADIARALGIRPGQVVIMFHCGSRGFGHQIATDYLKAFLKVMEPSYGIRVPDRELACAPFQSPEGKRYFSAMNCAINMSFANRQVILHRIREVFSEILGRSPEDMGLRMIYDVAHNTARLEDHVVDGQKRNLLVHRQGATRAFGPGRPELPELYRKTGQPVIIGGSMETGSYLLLGTPGGDQTFFSTSHGSGRTMSRHKARTLWRGKQLQHDMEEHGIYVKTASWSGLAEEAGGAYKDIDEVVEATEMAGISHKVVRFTPIGNIKG